MDPYNVAPFLQPFCCPSVYSKSCFICFCFFSPLPSTHRFTSHVLKKVLRSPPPPKAYEVCIGSLFLFWLVSIFIFHLPIQSSFVTGKKIMEEGNSQSTEVITYKNVMWRKRSYLPEGPLLSVLGAGVTQNLENQYDRLWHSVFAPRHEHPSKTTTSSPSNR